MTRAEHNPFNAYHNPSVDGNLSRGAKFKTIVDFRDELGRRGLICTGGRTELVERLKAHNKSILTPAGCKEIYQRKLEDYNKATMDQIVPCDSFGRLPVEIRLMIWELSLPAPRVLSVSSYPRSEKRLHLKTTIPRTLLLCQHAGSLERSR